MNSAEPWDKFPQGSLAILMLLHRSQWHADNFKEFEKTRLLLELVCKDTEDVLLKHVTRHLFLQIALHTVSVLKGNGKNGMSDVSGTWKVKTFFYSSGV